MSTWRSRAGSPRRPRGDAAAATTHELDPLGRGALGEELAHLVGDAAEIEVHAVELEAARLHTAEVEDVVDQPEEGVARAAQALGVVALLDREIGVEEERGHADDAGEQVAELVAELGERLGLGALLGELDARAATSSASFCSLMGGPSARREVNLNFSGGSRVRPGAQARARSSRRKHPQEPPTTPLLWRSRGLRDARRFVLQLTSRDASRGCAAPAGHVLLALSRLFEVWRGCSGPSRRTAL